MNRFKKGDKVICIQPSSRNLTKGKKYEIVRDQDSDNVYMICDDGKVDWWGQFRFELVLGKRGRPKKEKPIELHTVIEDSCTNNHGVYNTYTDAEKKANSLSCNCTIYKLQSVATVKSERRVVKFRNKKIKKIRC